MALWLYSPAWTPAMDKEAVFRDSLKPGWEKPLEMGDWSRGITANGIFLSLEGPPTPSPPRGLTSCYHVPHLRWAVTRRACPTGTVSCRRATSGKLALPWEQGDLPCPPPLWVPGSRAENFPKWFATGNCGVALKSKSVEVCCLLVVKATKI